MFSFINFKGNIREGSFTFSCKSKKRKARTGGKEDLNCGHRGWEANFVPAPKKFLLVLMMVCFTAIIPVLAGCSQEAEVQEGIEDPLFTPTDPDKIVEDPETGMSFVGGKVMLKVEEGVTREEVEEAAELVEGEVTGGLEELQIFEVSIPGKDADAVYEAMSELKARGIFEEVVPDYIPAAESGEEVPAVSQWEEGLEDKRWGQEYINLPLAWTETTGRSNFEVAIIDCGFDPNHRELQNMTLIEVNGVSWQEQGGTHGTSVASVLGALAGNGEGMAGVMWEPYKYCYQVSSFGDHATSLYDAYQKGIRVANISRGVDWDSYDTEGKSDAEILEKVSGIKAIKEPVISKVGSKTEQNEGMVVVTSAGNEPDVSADVNFPGGLALEYDNVITVGATDQQGNRTSFSSSGESVSVSAPGKRIWTASSDVADYHYINGTSFSSPLVAGVAGLLLSEDPGLSPGEVKQIIMDTAEPHNFDRPMGTGVVDAAAALGVEAEVSEMGIAEDMSDLEVGDRVVDNTWEWEHRLGPTSWDGTPYSYQDGDSPNEYEEARPVTWIVVAKDHYDEGGVTLLSENIIARHMFDNSTDRGHAWGSNHWGDSGTTDAEYGIRKFLNGSAYTGGDTNHYPVTFYDAFSESFQSGIIPTSVPTKAYEHEDSPYYGEEYTTTDHVFLPSQLELDGGDDHAHSAEQVWEYFIDAENEDRVAEEINGNTRWYWTRSPSVSYALRVRHVYSGGALGFYLAHYASDGARPALNLESEIPISGIPNDDGVYEIVW